MTDEVDCFTAMHTILHSFMKKGTYTDINFLIGESKIKAHKAILASCSTVFQTMFDTSMDEKESNEVVLTDVDEEVFSAFLDYIYVRDVKLVEKHTQGMLMLADKYDIEPLALLCDGLIEASLTTENAVESLFLADLYRRDALKTQVNLFIKQHLDDVSKNANWAKLDEHFDVMNGICHSFVLGMIVRWTRIQMNTPGPLLLINQGLNAYIMDTPHPLSFSWY
uniref:BTB domain-containing protein n=1 Tax=Lygus hesperus TaxID=30085 RepID=A0A0K8TD12_LYGHE